MTNGDGPLRVDNVIATAFFGNGDGGFLKFRKVFADRVANEQLALFLENHDADAHKRFGLRRYAEDGILRHRGVGFPISLPKAWR